MSHTVIHKGVEVDCSISDSAYTTVLAYGSPSRFMAYLDPESSIVGYGRTEILAVMDLQEELDANTVTPDNPALEKLP